MLISIKFGILICIIARLEFINNAFSDGYVQTTGTGLTKILPPVSRFTSTGERTQKRETVIEKIKAFFNRFWDISGSGVE